MTTGDTPEAGVRRYRITWRGDRGCYTVDVPQWDGGIVVLASDYERTAKLLWEAAKERDALAARLAAAEKDAARYRWLRNTPPWDNDIAITSQTCLAQDGSSVLFYTQDALDKVCDAALAALASSGSGG